MNSKWILAYLNVSVLNFCFKWKFFAWLEKIFTPIIFHIVHKITVTSLSLQNADADTDGQLERSFESSNLDWLENCYSSEDADDDHNEETIPVKERRILKPKGSMRE